LKLLIATPLFPPESGGPATYAAILERELPSRGIEVALAKFSSVRGYPKLIRHLAYFCLVYMRGRKADAILALDPVSTGLPAMLAARMLHKPFFVKIVGDYAWEQGTQRFGVRDSLDEFVLRSSHPFFVQVLKRIERMVALGAVKVLVPSQYLKKIVSSWRVPEAHIEVVHNAVSVEAIGGVPEAVRALGHPVVVSVGRLVPWKGMHGLIEAMEKIRETIPATLAIVGSGPELDALRADAKRKLGKAAILTGQLSHEDTLAVMEAGDVFVLNTSYEGLSHLLIEALSLGKPIVTTSVGGNTELITHGDNGMLVRANECKELAEALRAILKDGPLRERLSVSAKESAKRFTVEALADRTAALLTSLI
jgi:glycosyltransferase involved in cell wall biosynthesis